MSDGHERYKITRTTTGADGKIHQETIEMVDKDALRLMTNFHLGNETSSSSLKRQNEDEFVSEALKIHNDYRRKHGVAPLHLNNELTKLAQQWANHLASTGSLVHSKTKYRNDYLGENLYCQSWPMTGKEMCDAWYSEGERYDYNDRRSYQSGTGHFTQMIWKKSDEVGFARAESSTMNFAVAMYFPAGNFLGEYFDNVHRPSTI